MIKSLTVNLMRHKVMSHGRRVPDNMERKASYPKVSESKARPLTTLCGYIEMSENLLLYSQISANNYLDSTRLLKRLVATSGSEMKLIVWSV